MFMRLCNHAFIISFLSLSLERASSKSPNIVFFLADDYGWNDIGYHGSEINTPNLDKIASDGVKLENYFVQPICTPTRSQLLSGRYQIHTGLQHGIVWPAQENGLPLNIPTIADKLKEIGYATHMIGKWHVGFYEKEYLPINRGFDSSLGYLTGAEDYYTRKRCYDFARGGKQYNLCGLDFHQNERPFNSSGEYSTSYFAEQAKRIIEEHVKYESDKPLFLYLPFQSVHAPLQVPDRYIQPYAHIKDDNRRIFSGMVSCMDEAVGNITRALMDNHLWDDTVFIFSTDNGGQVHEGGNNWPLRGYKATLWDGGLRGVGFVHSSRLERRGAVSMELMHVSDWFPTLLTLAGGETRGLQLDGYNVWDTISKNIPSPRKELLHNIDPLTPKVGKALPGAPFDTRVRAAIRVGNWKLITGNPGDGSWVPPPSVDGQSLIDDVTLRFSPGLDRKNVWLFDVSIDPTEKTDLSTSRPDVLTQLLARLAFYNSTAVPCRYPDNDPAADPKKLGGYWGPWVEGTYGNLS